MATTKLGIISTGVVRGIPGAGSKEIRGSSFRNRGGQRAFLLLGGKSFRAFRMIRKSPQLSKSPRRNRWSSSTSSRSLRLTTSAMVDMGVSFNYMAKEQEAEVIKNFATGGDDANMDDAGGEDSSKVLDTVNAVLADIVDGQKFIKETGRTKPRAMKRRALVVCLALNGFRDPLNEVEGRLGMSRSSSTSCLARVPSSGFARTAHLISQLSFEASSKSPGGSRVADTSISLDGKTETYL